MSEPQQLRIQGYRVANELFTLGYPRACGPFGCDAACCKRGAYVDLGERDRILAHKSFVQQVMTVAQVRAASRWFEPEPREDRDFPSGSCVGTAEIDQRCVFLDQSARCSLQLAALAQGLHKWALKPRYCVLFPIDVEGDLIKFDFRLLGKRACCSPNSTFEVPLFRACHEELKYLVGEAGFEAFEAHYRLVQANAATHAGA